MTSVAMTAALVVVIPATARAQDAEDAEITKMAKEHYRLGVEAFKAGKYPDAIKELKKAYLLKRLPPLLVNIAKTYEKLNDLDNAIYYYKKYLAEAPPDAKDRDEIKKALADVQAKKDAPPPSEEPEAATRPGGGGDEPPPPPPKKVRPVEEPPVEEPPPPPPKKGGRPAPVVAPPPKKVEPEPQPEPPPPPKKVAPESGGGGGRASGTAGEWVHNPPDSSPPNTCLDIKVQTPVMKGVKVWLYYRGLGDTEFTKVEMKRKGADKRGTIPAEFMGGKSIQYYIEAVDSTGAVVKNAGTQLDPNIVFLDPTAAPQCASGDRSGGDECAEDDIACQEARAAEQRKKDAQANKRKYCEEHPLEPECKQPGRPRGGGAPRGGSSGPALSGLGYGGIGLAVGGAIVAGVGGGLGFYYAQLYSDQVWNDAFDNACRFTALGGSTKKEKCYFNDPGITPSDLDFQTRGKTWGIVAPVAIGVGAAMVVGGVTMTVLDYLKLHPSAPPPKKKVRKGRDESSGGEQSSIQDLMILPTLTPNQVGLDAGFRF